MGASAASAARRRSGSVGKKSSSLGGVACCQASLNRAAMSSPAVTFSFSESPDTQCLLGGDGLARLYFALSGGAIGAELRCQDYSLHCTADTPPPCATNVLRSSSP